MIINALSRLFALFYLLTRVNWLQAIKNYNHESEVVIWMIPCWPKIWRYNDSIIINDIALIKYFTDRNLSFRIVIGAKIGRISNKKIYFNCSRLYNPFELLNWTASLQTVLLQLEKQGNTLYPSAKEVLWWENKAFMYKEFDRLNIKHPKTYYFSEAHTNSLNSIKYPCLYKEVHTAGSVGMELVHSMEGLVLLIKKKNEQGIYDFLIQELVNMRKDLRVTIIGESIVLYYWRINQSDEWKPTSTGHGSSVDFVNFPEKWRSKIISALRLTGLRTGGFDITWEDDNLETDPIFLEVSPSYLPNPKPNRKHVNSSYSAFKKDLFCKDPYWKLLVDTILSQKAMLLELYQKDREANANDKYLIQGNSKDAFN